MLCGNRKTVRESIALSFNIKDRIVNMGFYKQWKMNLSKCGDMKEIKSASCYDNEKCTLSNKLRAAKELGRICFVLFFKNGKLGWVKELTGRVTSKYGVSQFRITEGGEG